MPKARTYFTLAIRADGVWSPQFGDYDRETVEQEARDMRDSDSALRSKDCKVISSGDSQDAINAAIAKLNAKAAQ